MKKLIFLLFLLIPSVCFATLASTTVWEVRTTGTATNGGGFNSAQDAVNGVDYSQQDAAQLTLTDGATSGIGVTTFTSATGGFTHAMEGNIIYISAGTNATVGYYEIVTYTDTNTVTLDRAPDDGVGAVSGANFKVGGAVDHPYRIGADFIMDESAKAWIKKGAYTYIGGDYVFNAENIMDVEGYDTTRGDKPVIEANMPRFDGDNLVPLDCVKGPRIKNCVAYNSTNQGIRAWQMAINCIGRNNAASGIIAPLSVDCEAYANAGNGFGRACINCIAYDNDIGFNISDASIVNCIAYNNTTFGFSGNAICFDYNCYFGNGTDLDGITAGTHDVNADPLLVDPANGDFTLRAGSPCLSAGLSAIAGLTSDFNINIGVDQNDHGTAPHTTLRNCTIRNGTIR